MFIQYCMLGDFIFSIPFLGPAAIQRRSILSFLILTFLSYYLLKRFYILVFKNSNLKFMSFLIFGLSIWFQFLSVQYIGWRSSGKYLNDAGNYSACTVIIEYYSIFEFDRSECIRNDKCFYNINSDSDLYTYLMCKTDNDISIFKKIFFKKYKTYDKKSIYVLDGIGPFFTLSISENGFE